jgi:transcriptional regulator with XRE-family HTH domain
MNVIILKYIEVICRIILKMKKRGNLKMYGKKIRSLREDNKLYQKEFADKLGVSQSAVTKWENDLADPTDDKIELIIQMFNVPREYFYGTETIVVEKKDDVSLLIDKLVNEGIIKDPNDISEEIAEIIINAVKQDLRMRKLKEIEK